jgi:hypothetical protein
VCCYSTYSSNWGTTVLTRMRMSHISTKYDCRSISYQRNSLWDGIYQHGVPAPNLCQIKGCQLDRHRRKANCKQNAKVEGTGHWTLTLIFRARFARICLFILKTCFVQQHCETIPRSISQTRFKSPSISKETSNVNRELHNNNHENPTTPQASIGRTRS